MNKRLRKKKHIGEFKELGFALLGTAMLAEEVDLALVSLAADLGQLGAELAGLERHDVAAPVSEEARSRCASSRSRSAFAFHGRRGQTSGVGSPQTLTEDERRAVAAWAADCAQRALALFEAEAPRDGRPRAAVARARLRSRRARYRRGDPSPLRRRWRGA